MSLQEQISQLSPLKQALIKINELQARLQQAEAAQNEPIAVVGMGCRFPGPEGRDVTSPAAFWQMLQNGQSAQGELPWTRWHSTAEESTAVRTLLAMQQGHFLQQIDQFDAQFFGISPREAAQMDPQHRLLLEVSVAALEDANLAIEDLAGQQTGVYIGLMNLDYTAVVQNDPATLDVYAGTGTEISSAAGRLSYLLGLRGPSMTVGTACSSSLVTTHLACQALRRRECDLALSGGVSLQSTATSNVMLSLMQAVAPDGRSKTFDADANGYGRGEGCGVVVLKRLSDALADQDTLYAVIRGSAVNHNGRSGGFTVPSGPAQEALIQQALAAAQVDAHQVSYVEAHGTGTFLGDPIELSALGNVLCAETRSTPLWVGSVKTNIGHLEPAAGVAGLIKVVLSIYHRQIPPHLHFHRPNPHIPWAQFPIQIPTALADWPANTARVAGVSSFGLSGVNAHLIVAEAPAPPERVPPTPHPWQLLTLSAKTPKALHELAAQYQTLLHSPPEADWPALCYTTHVGRSHFSHRLAVVAEDTPTAQELLARSLAGETPAGVSQAVAPEAPPKVAFLFTGQGAQYLYMGQELYATHPLFRQVIDRCDAVTQSCLGRSLVELLYPADPPTHHDLWTSHPCGQVATYAIECALAELWKSWGITPALVLGHSLGDFAAAYTAGVFSLEEGLRLVSRRGQLMESAGGSMVSVLASAADVEPFLKAHPQVALAVFNGPASVVLSGENRALQTVADQLQMAGFKIRPLAIPVAAHSPLLDPVLADFETAAQRIPLSLPHCTVVSSMTGQTATTELTDPAYWRQHLRQPVRFAAGAQSLLEHGCTIFLEVGPKPVLLGLLETLLASTDPQAPPHQLLPSLRENSSAWRSLSESLASLYVHGCPIQWPAVDLIHSAPEARPPRKVALPTYPFQRERYWATSSPRRPLPLRPLVDRRFNSPLHQATIFEAEFSLNTLPFLADHRVFGTLLSPGACQLTMILHCAALTFGQQPIALTDVVLPQTLAISDDGTPRTVQTVLTPAATPPHTFECQLISFDPNNAAASVHTHLTGQVAPAPHWPVEPVDLAALRRHITSPVDVAAFYTATSAQSIELGPCFQWIVALWRNADEALAHCTAPETVSLSGYLLHPGLLDACFQVVGAATPNNGETRLPFAIDALYLSPAIAEPTSRSAQTTHWWCHASAVAPHRWQIRLLDQEGQLLAAINGYETRAAPPAAVQGTEPWREWLYTVAWQPRPLFGLPPDSLPAPAALLHPLPPPPPMPAAEQSLLSTLEQRSVEYVLAALTQMGLSFQPGTRWRTEQLAHQLGVLPAYRRLWTRALTILAEAGILQASEGEWQVLQTPKVLHPETNLTAPETPALTLLTRCGARLSEVLRGLQEPLDLLFPEGSLETLTHLYTETPEARLVNGALQQLLEQITSHFPHHRGLRLLEIGAGTGSSTATLLPQLQQWAGRQEPSPLEYLFTDVGPTFLTQAHTRFADYEFLRCQLLDIEQDPTAQGFPTHHYDIVLAVNVLHATQKLPETLAHVRKLLQPGGLLILVETSRRRHWLDLTFGLTEGWWRFADERTHPLLSRTAWEALLAASGFSGTTSLPFYDQTLLVTQAPSPAPPTGRVWLLLADAAGVGAALASELQQRGEQPLLVYPAELYAQPAANTYSIRPDLPADFQALLATLPDLHGVVHLWGIAPSLTHPDSPAETTRQGCSTLLHLTQALLQRQRPPKLWLVTQAAQAATADDHVEGFAQAPLWGMGKVISLEHPELGLVCIDLDATRPAAQAAALCAEMTDDPLAPETQVALRQNRRYVARLQHYPPPPALPLPPTPYRLEVRERGTLDQLQLSPVPRQPPSAGEVEIRVQACGLNFLDLLDVLGILPFQRDRLGGECAGEIVALGPGVTRFQPGDRVLAVKGSFSEYITVAADLVAPIPPPLTWTEAATLPINFLTAYYALHTVGRIAPGDKVLIHAATGGTGLAAVQIALAAGADVYATASPSKWATLQAMGVSHLYHSRTLEFAEQIQRETDGHGVDLVLNSLTSEGFIAKSLSVLAPKGRFLEIAKRDIWSAADVKAFRADVEYHVVDLFTLIDREPAQIRTLLDTLTKHVAAGTWVPVPQSCFPIHSAPQAFRYMQQARHIGKIVLTLPVRHNSSIRADATYWITGGLGGLGLAVARWLAAEGARHLLLTGRTRPTPAVQTELDALTAQGVAVTVAQNDVTDPAQVHAQLAAIDPLYPLRGVIHAVGVLRDGALLQQNWSHFAEVLAPKVQGTWSLHQATQTLPLDFFVLFSSGTSLLGNRGQANHAAANAFLDAFAHYRQAQGLPALSINWGAWSEIGAAADLVRTQQPQLAARGIGSIPPSQGIQSLAYLLQQPDSQVGVVPVQWTQYLTPPSWPFYTQLAQATPKTVAVGPQQPARLRQQLNTARPDQRAQQLLQHLRNTVASVLGLRTPEQIDPRQGLLGLGIDSLMAIELRNRLGRSLEHPLPTTLIFDYPTLEQLQQFLINTLFAESPPTTADKSSTPPLDPAGGNPQALTELSAEALMAQIAAEFEKL
ncbi:MAG: SDR family NAD(P)-dependent oxidoreductase [Chloroflexi bacterium]|nr:SDR family NAD(P)-dependent oxidoreductase [Chloroflexota bacterium]